LRAGFLRGGHQDLLEWAAEVPGNRKILADFRL